MYMMLSVEDFTYYYVILRHLKSAHRNYHHCH